MNYHMKTSEYLRWLAEQAHDGVKDVPVDPYLIEATTQYLSRTWPEHGWPSKELKQTRVLRMLLASCIAEDDEWRP